MAAAFQSVVYIDQGFGVIGEMIQDGPNRTDVLTLDNNGGTIGRAFTKSELTNTATQGGTIGASTAFAGILVNPKVYAARGTPNPLDPTLSVLGNSNAEFMTMGTIVVSVSTACNIGDFVQYNTTTGALSTVSSVSSFTASQAAGVLTVTAITQGQIGVGSVITSGSVIIGTVMSLGTGTGGTGTYNLSTSATVASTTMTGTGAATTGNALVPNAVVWNFPITGSGGLTTIRLTN